jgi:hypothetical protein
MSALGQKQTYAWQKAMSALLPNAEFGSAFCVYGALMAAPMSNKIIQKGLASSRKQSGSVSRSLRFRILPRRLVS